MATTTASDTATPYTAPPTNLFQSWGKTLSNAMIVTRREVRDSFRDWRIVAPIILLTFLFPFLAQSVASRFSNWLVQFGAEIIGERTIPFLLMIVGFFPISISLVIALETFVGEKERRSLEPLLSTPLTNTELYIGKTLSAMIPPLVASFGGMTLYLITVLGGELAWRPPPMLIVQIFLLTIVQALVMVTGAVVVSSQTTSTRAANLLASFIIIPMTLIINGESFIMFVAPDAESPTGIGALWAIIAGMSVVVVLLLRVGNSIFNREELLGRTIDTVNLRKAGSNIWKWMRAVDDEGNTAKNPIDWYRRAIPYSLKKLAAPVVVTLIVFTTAFIFGFGIGLQPEWRLPLPEEAELIGSPNISLEAVYDRFSGSAAQANFVSLIIVQNGRILLGGLLLSMFTFGVGGLVITPIVYTIAGYLLSQLIIAQYDVSLFWAAILPHGVVEIPMIILATALMVHLGASVTRPPKRETVGATWTKALGDTLKLSFGLVIPMLIIAAILEVTLTPYVVLQVIGG